MMYAMSIIARTSADIHIFHRIISEWIMNIHADIRSDGYIVDNPSSLCGKKVKELRDHCMTKSAEISTIRIQTRRSRTSCVYMLRRSLYFVLENLLPFIVSIGTFGIVYWLWTRSGYTRQKNSSYAEHTGQIIGSILHSVMSFGSSLIDGTTGTDMFFTKLQALILSSAVAGVLYIGTIPFTSIITYARTTSAKQEELRMLQDEFRLEYTNLIEQALYKHVIANILEAFEHMLYITSDSASDSIKQHAIQIANMYYPNYDIFYMYILSQLETSVREMDVVTLIRSVNMTSQFINVLFQLIRHSEDGYARDLMLFNQALVDSPIHSKGAILTSVSNTLKI